MHLKAKNNSQENERNMQSQLLSIVSPPPQLTKNLEVWHGI
jgi:hypothetical protein